MLWLADTGHQVRLFVGDTKDGSDGLVVDEILAQVPVQRPDLAADQVIAAPVESFGDLMDVMAPAGAIIATRYHNLICALRLAKPTISLSYAAKHDTLMSAMGLAEFSQQAAALDLDRSDRAVHRADQPVGRVAAGNRPAQPRARRRGGRSVRGHFQPCSSRRPLASALTQVRPMTATWTAEVKK